MSTRSIPVTLVSGFAGAGKSVLVENLKRALEIRRPSFIYNDGESDLIEKVETAVDMEGADLIVVENICHLEPYAVADFLAGGDEGRPPPKKVRLDTLVTVVDASTLIRDLLGSQDLLETLTDCDPEDDRTVGEVLIEQIEFADVLILNKMDLVSRAELRRAEALLARLNPRARILPAIFGRVPSQEVIGTQLFDFEKTDEGAGWLAELDGLFNDTEASDGVSSFTYIERRPFHPLRFNELLGDMHVKGLVRAKGSIWVASRHHEIGIWSYAGGASMLNYGGAWFAATPARDWPTDERERAEIMSEWVPPFGDRRQEIAFIGIDMDEREIRDRLNECLLTSREMRDGPDGWFSMPDPLPDWHVSENT